MKYHFEDNNIMEYSGEAYHANFSWYRSRNTRFSNCPADNKSKVSVKKSQIDFVHTNFLSSTFPYMSNNFMNGWKWRFGFWELLPDLDFFKHHFLRVFEKWDPGIFPKSQISKISCSSHSKKSHIKLNLNFWCRAERCAPPTRAVYPPWWGNRYSIIFSSKNVLLLDQAQD